jgi:SOS-response transcriptional repressor LexA
VHIRNPKEIYALRAVGDSMNRASIRGQNIETGDFVIIDSGFSTLNTGDYVVSLIDGLANIKRLFKDPKHDRILLISESEEFYPPIIIAVTDFVDYHPVGRVIDVVKNFTDIQGIDAAM